MSNQKSPQKRVDIGGQAVMEGVMMKGPDAIAVAVRRPNGTIVVKRDTYTPPSKKHKWMGYPFFRGIIGMGSMLSLGMRTLQTSSDMLGIMDEEPSKFEKWLSKKLGKGIDKIVMFTAAALAIVLSIGLFFCHSRNRRHPAAQGDLLPCNGQPAKRRSAYSDFDWVYAVLRHGARCAPHVPVSRRGA